MSDECRIMRQVVGKNPEGSIDTYLSVDWTDSHGRYAEVRLLKNESGYTLNANIGDGMSLLELQSKLKAAGLTVNKLVCYMANADVVRILKAAGKVNDND